VMSRLIRESFVQNTCVFLIEQAPQLTSESG
jgi:hypothetical protein